MEASTLTTAARHGLLTRRSPVLRLERDERLVSLIRAGNDRAFEVLVDRYQSRLLAFCASMLKSRQDAEDILQEVFVKAHAAMLADDRPINVRPWLYRIARNRCLNHLRRPVPEGQDSMDIHPHLNGTSTAERVQGREDLRALLEDVSGLPETQKTALLLREIDQLSYDEIAVAMDTTIPAVKSLLVRARITLAESSQARALTCDEVRLTLAEIAEGIRKADGPTRIHLKRCEGCRDFRSQLRKDHRAFAALFPIGPLAILKTGLFAKLFGGGGAAGAGAAGTAGGTSAAGAGIAASGAGATALGGGAAAGGIGAVGGAIGTKAAAGLATAAVLAAGAVEVKHVTSGQPQTNSAPIVAEASPPPAPADGGEPEPSPKSFKKRMVALATPATAAASAESASATEDADAKAGEAEATEEPEAETNSTAGIDDADEVAIDDGAPADDGGPLEAERGPVADAPVAGGIGSDDESAPSESGTGSEASDEPPPAAPAEPTPGDAPPASGGNSPTPIDPTQPPLPPLPSETPATPPGEAEAPAPGQAQEQPAPDGDSTPGPESPPAP